MKTLLAVLLATLAVPATASAVVVKGRPHTELALAGSSPIWWEAGGTLYSAVDGRRRVLHRDTTSCIGSYSHLQASGRHVAAVHHMTRLENGDCYGSGGELLIGSARALRVASFEGCGASGAIDGDRALVGCGGGGWEVRDLRRGTTLGRVPYDEPFSTSVYRGATALAGRYAAYVLTTDEIVMYDWQARRRVGRWSIAALRGKPFVGDLAPQVRVAADGLLVASVPPYEPGGHALVWARAGDARLRRVPFRKFGAWGLHGRTIAAARLEPRVTGLFTLGGKTLRTLARGFGGGAAISATHVAWITAGGGTIRVVRR